LSLQYSIVEEESHEFRIARRSDGEHEKGLGASSEKGKVALAGSGGVVWGMGGSTKGKRGGQVRRGNSIWIVTVHGWNFQRFPRR